MLLDQAPQSLLDDMGVDLCGRDIGMAEELLHRAEIGAALQKMTGERVTEHVRRDARRFDPRGKGKRLELLAEALPCEMLASGRWEEPRRHALPFLLVGVDGGEVGLTRGLCRLVQGHKPLAPAFAFRQR